CVASRGDRAHSPLLRDRRAQHLSHLSALRGDARPHCARGSGGGGGAREGAAACWGRAASCRVSERVGVDRGGGVQGLTESELGTVDALTHEGEGVVHGGKTVFVAGALPGELV